MKKLILLFTILALIGCNVTMPQSLIDKINAKLDSIPTTQPQTATQPAPTVPNAPTGLLAVSGTAQVALTWATQTDATSYNLYFGTAPGVHGSSILNVTSPYLHTGLTNGTNYYYVLTAVNAVGESLPSAEVHATAGVIDRHNGTIYITTLNQTWPKCAQVDITGKNMYNPLKDDCSGGVMGYLQNCSTNDMTCAPAPGYILNGSGYSEIWLSCNNNTLAGRVWRVPRDNELIAFQPVFIVNQTIFPGITTDGYWSANDDWNMAGRVMLYDGFESYPDRRWLNPVTCVSDGI